MTDSLRRKYKGDDMGDIAEVAKLLIGKAEEYGQLLETEAFPLFVQREILWGHINQALGWAGIGFIVLAIIFIILGGTSESYEVQDWCFPVGFFVFFAGIAVSVTCFINAALLLKSPELSAITTILRIITEGGK